MGDPKRAPQILVRAPIIVLEVTLWLGGTQEVATT